MIFKWDFYRCRATTKFSTCRQSVQDNYVSNYENPAGVCSSNCNRNSIDEVIYPTLSKPEEVFHIAQGSEKICVSGVTAGQVSCSSFCSFRRVFEVTPSLILSRLLEGRPNTYTFTKSLAEQVVDSYRGQLPWLNSLN